MVSVPLWKRMLLTSCALSAACALAPIGAQAQDASDQAPETAEEDAFPEEIVVTGSRVRRNEFNSISPLQVVDVEGARELGVTSFDDLLL